MLGIFDSGIGGISILNRLIEVGAATDYVYVADTAYLPYGNQTPATLLKRGRIISQFFLDQGITHVVVACHTSSATTLPTIQKEFPQITFVDMLEPTVTKAIQTTHNNIVGVFATPATINSHAHKKLFEMHAPDINVIEQPCPELVPLIESNTPKEAITETLQNYLTPIKQTGADTLILGCTHYPFVRKLIQTLAPELQLISAADCIEQTKQAYKKPTITFITTSEKDYSETINRFLSHATYTLTFHQL